MATAALERFESVNLYTVHETQAVTELDSPAIGTEFTIAKREAVYEFFSSRKKARECIQRLRKEYMSRNKTLKLFPDRLFIGFALQGKVDHIYSHVFEIRHAIECESLPPPVLPKNLEALLNSPRRRIVEDKRNSPEFPEYLKMPKPDFSKIVLF